MKSSSVGCAVESARSTSAAVFERIRAVVSSQSYLANSSENISVCV